MNLRKAITLLKTFSGFPYNQPEKKLSFSIFECPNDEYVLLAKTDHIHEEQRNHVKKIAKSNTLRIEESKGLIIIYDPCGKCSSISNLF